VYNNKLYIFGGYETKPTSTMYSDTWVFDPMAASGSKWSQIAGANLSVARTSIGGATLDGYIYAIGGNTVSGVVSTTTTPQTIVERMNPSLPSPIWSTVASLPTARGDMGVWAYNTGSSYEIAGKIMVSGGKYPTPDSNTYLYDPVSNSWSAGISMTRARRNFGYTQLGGKLYAFGGYNVTSTYNGANDSMVYDGSTGGPTPTNTTTPPTATSTTVPTNTPTNTNTNTPVPTNTNTNTPIPTNTRTNTPVPTNTPTGTVVPPTATNTATRTNTSVPTSTSVPTNTNVPATSTNTATGTAVPPSETPTETATETPIPPTTLPTPGACTVAFSDVPEGSTFYDYIHCLACHGIIAGYDDGTFRPQNNITRGQIAKIVAKAGGYDDGITDGFSTFQDVTPNSTFWLYVERLALYDVMSGYECGGPGEPCVAPDNKPYFRPFANATRGQIAKIVSNSAGFNDEIQAGTQTFEDVTEGSTFHIFVERLLLNRPGAMGGYPCGDPGEPCGAGNKPYFRPSDNATRGQTSKIVTNIFFPDCVAPVYVKIQDFGFHPASVAVAPGTTVRFVNRDPAGHTATADDASWDTGLLFQNQYADVVFNASSTYDCDPHPFMRGEIIVSTGKR
jgi:hypothetical protein